MTGILKRFFAICRTASLLIVLAVFAGPVTAEAASAPPKAGRLEGGPEVFRLDGDFFTPARGSEVKTWKFAAPNDSAFKKIVVELDVAPSGWWARNPDGVHNIFWLTRRGKWRSDTVGYVNLFGPRRSLLKQMTNLDLPKGEVRAKTTRFAAQKGRVYHIVYTYDCTTGLITTVVTEKGVPKASIEMRATASKIQTKGGFYQLWIGLEEKHDECPTIGWTYSNLRIRLGAASAAGSTPGSVTKRKPALGPLTVHSANPRYFDDGTGRAVLLVGVNHGWELQDDAWSTKYTLDWPVFLDYLTRHKLNYIRLWRVESTTGGEKPAFLTTPMPYRRTGPGVALDGRPRWDLEKFDPAYFDRLRKRCVEAGRRGIYVCIMLFERHSSFNQRKSGGAAYPWKAHPFHPANNVNGLAPDIDGDGCPRELHHLPRKGLAPGKRRLAEMTLRVQKAYVRKVIDTVNDLDNVIFEVCNEALPDEKTDAWQRHLVDFVKACEADKPKQHVVGFTGPGRESKTDPWPALADQLASRADFVSPRNGDRYLVNPPAATGKKVVFADSDHISPFGRDHIWVWKSFTRGLHPQALEGYDASPPNPPKTNPARDKLVRRSLGLCLEYADRMNLAVMTPHAKTSSTGYCLANPGAEYLAFAPAGGAFTIDLSAARGAMVLEWLQVGTGKRLKGKPIAGGATRRLTPPFAGPAAAYITVASPAKPPKSVDAED
jgi:hypothetical protein